MGELKLSIYRTRWGRELFKWFDQSDIHDDVFFIIADIHQQIKHPEGEWVL